MSQPIHQPSSPIQVKQLEPEFSSNVDMGYLGVNDFEISRFRTPSPVFHSTSPFSGDLLFEKEFTKGLEKEFKRSYNALANENADLDTARSNKDKSNVKYDPYDHFYDDEDQMGIGNKEEEKKLRKQKKENDKISKAYGIGIEKYMEKELLKLQGKLTASIAAGLSGQSESSTTKKTKRTKQANQNKNLNRKKNHNLTASPLSGRIRHVEKPNSVKPLNPHSKSIDRHPILTVNSQSTEKRAKSSGATLNLASTRRMLETMKQNNNPGAEMKKSSSTLRKNKRFLSKGATKKSKSSPEKFANVALINTQFTKDELEHDAFLDQFQRNKDKNPSGDSFVQITSMSAFREQIAIAGTRLVLVLIYVRQPLFTKIELENIARTYQSKIKILLCNYAIESNKVWIEKLAAKYNKSSSVEHMENYCIFFMERGRLLWPHPAFRTPLLMEDEDELFGPFVNDWFVLSQRQERNMVKIFGRNDFENFGFMHKRGFPAPKDFIPGSSTDLLRRPQMIGFIIANASSQEVEKHFTTPLKSLYDLVKKKYHEYALEIVYIPFDKNKKLFLQATKNFTFPLLPYEDTDIKAHICKVFNVNRLPALFLTNLNQEFHYIEVNNFPSVNNENELLETYQIWRKILIPKIRRYQPIPFEYIANLNAMNTSPRKRQTSPKKKILQKDEEQIQQIIPHEVDLDEQEPPALPSQTSHSAPQSNKDHSPNIRDNDIAAETLKKQFPSYLSTFQKNIKLLFPNLLITRDKKTFRTFDRLRHNRVLGLLFVNPEHLTKKHQFKFIRQVSKFYQEVKKLDPQGFEIIFVPYTTTQREMLSFMHENEMNFLSLPFDVAAEYREILEKMFQVFITPRLLVLNIHLRGGAYQVGVDPSDNFSYIMKQYRHLYLKWIRDLDVQS